MPFYLRLGTLPKKRHTQFRRPDGVLYSEELFGTEGFVGPTSTMYHINPPTQVYGWKTLYTTRAEFVETDTMRMRHVKSAPLPPRGDAVTGRVVLFGNSDVEMAVCNPDSQMGYHYKNGQGDECLFVHFGSGVVFTMMGALRFGPKDYVVIPKGVIYRLVWDEPAKGQLPAGAPATLTPAQVPLGKFLLIETMNGSHIGPPPRYISKATAQFLEHAPYCERDLRTPVHEPDAGLPMFSEEYGEFEVRVKARDRMHSYIFHYHPLDVVGWDGCYYPYAFNIDDFAPITGKLHMPPPIHQTFEAHNFVICSFCPRMLDWHPDAVKVPYNHSNIDSDEVLYYVEGNFGSRKGIEVGSLTLHPQGIPHGPHPGTLEASMAHTFTGELAVMCDTFRPLFPTKAALGLEDEKYPASWQGEHFPRLRAGEGVANINATLGVNGGPNIAPRPATASTIALGTMTAPSSAGPASTGANTWAPNADAGANGPTRATSASKKNGHAKTPAAASRASTAKAPARNGAKKPKR